MGIGFNKPYLTGRELEYIGQAVATEKISGDGLFTKRCHQFFETRYGFSKVLLTTSCTDALEMASLLADIKEGDEVIAPAYTFVSTVNAFVLRGASIVFADSQSINPCIDVRQIESLITSRTKAIVVVHYAGIACDMDNIMSLAEKHNLIVIEDAAQAVDSYFKGRPLGSIGHLATFSFHETKNIISGEGGMLVINDPTFIKRAEIIREKGTNRSAFFRGEVDKYTWVDVGSSFLPSEIIAAFLWAQLENLEHIQKRRVEIWNMYYEGLSGLLVENQVQIPVVPDYATNNGHMFYLVCKNLKERSELISYLLNRGIQAVFHYQSLNKSPFYRKYSANFRDQVFTESDRYTDCLLRLPLYFELTDEQVKVIIDAVKDFYEWNKQ